jgi:hypothetical protein
LMMRGVRMVFGMEPGDRLDRFFDMDRRPSASVSGTGRPLQGALRAPPGSGRGDSKRTAPTAAHASETGRRRI